MKCPNCKTEMVEKGYIGRTVRLESANEIGVKPEVLYQCHKCKEILID